MRGFSLRIGFVLTLIPILVFLGCTKKNTNIEVDVPGHEKLSLPLAETLRINLISEPPSIDWEKMSDSMSVTVIANIMDGLINYDLADKQHGLKPALALKWEPSEGARKWKLTLRPGVRWTDGVEFSAQQVVDGWQRLLEPSTASTYAYFLFGVKNAQAFNQGKIKDFSEVGIKATGPLELQIELERPMSYFPYLIAHHVAFPVRLDLIRKFGDKWTEPENIQTLGAYKLKIWQHDKQIVLERNDSYYGDKALTRYVICYMIQEQATALNLFESGKLDSVNHLPSAELRTLRQKKEYHEIGILQTYFYGFNTGLIPMNNLLVRQAIAHVIDRQQIVQILSGGEIPLSDWIPVGMVGYEANLGLNFDPIKAKELLKKAGYGDAKKFPKITLAFNTNEDHQRIAEIVQSQLKSNLGIDVELKNEEWKVYLNHLQSSPAPMFRFGWLADYPDPDTFMAMMTSFSDTNHTRWKNDAYDKLVAEGASETDPNRRRDLYVQAQKILVEDEVPAVPIYSAVSRMLVADRVENYPITAIDLYVFKGVRLK